jgi:hypothetical protein
MEKQICVTVRKLSRVSFPLQLNPARNGIAMTIKTEVGQISFIRHRQGDISTHEIRFLAVAGRTGATLSGELNGTRWRDQPAFAATFAIWPSKSRMTSAAV